MPWERGNLQSIRWSRRQVEDDVIELSSGKRNVAGSKGNGLCSRVAWIGLYGYSSGRLIESVCIIQKEGIYVNHLAFLLHNIMPSRHCFFGGIRVIIACL